MSRKINTAIGGSIILLGIAYWGIDLTTKPHQPSEVIQPQATEIQHHIRAQDDVLRIENAFKHQLGNLQVQSKGRVVAILKDDLEGSRHQRFLLALANGQTVLVAHNIDLTPRIDALQQNDVIEFYGEYEYNAKGGVIHWTHHDPRGKHVDGWLKHRGKIYQ